MCKIASEVTHRPACAFTLAEGSNSHSSDIGVLAGQVPPLPSALALPSRTENHARDREGAGWRHRQVTDPHSTGWSLKALDQGSHSKATRKQTVANQTLAGLLE